MSPDRIEAAHRYVDYLFATRDNGRFDALEHLFAAWKGEARPSVFVTLGSRLAGMAARRRRAPVVHMVTWIEERAVRGLVLAVVWFCS